MKFTLRKFIRLMLGFIICALGIVLMVNANLGLAPWDVLHGGISKLVGITMGQANILVAIIVVLFNIIIGENVGWGTILNMIIIGWFIDIFMLNNIVPVSTNFSIGIIMMFSGMLVLSLGCYLYIGVGIGTGARDGMMVAIQKKTGKSIRFVRNMIEVGALTIGFLLGGKVGIGTIISSLFLGHFIQFIFKIFKFDVSSICHRYIIDDIKYLRYAVKNKINKKQNCLSIENDE